jgi:hypothetical protein
MLEITITTPYDVGYSQRAVPYSNLLYPVARHTIECVVLSLPDAERGQVNWPRRRLIGSLDSSDTLHLQDARYYIITAPAQRRAEEETLGRSASWPARHPFT